MRVIILALLLHALFGIAAAFASESTASSQDEKSWWQQRNESRNLYYPHKVHFEVMEEKGDSCMLCHSFNANPITNKKKLKQINTISNEPLLAICHSCHVDEKTAPSECSLCHDDKRSIWPQDHNLDFITHHGSSALMDEAQCESCHLDQSFCTDCHFKRTFRTSDYHSFGYIGRHGIEVRAYAADCGSCHNPDYCAECHEGGR